MNLRKVNILKAKPLTMEPRMISSELLGERLRLLRIEKELTAERLAELSDISQGYLSLVERGKRRPTAPVLDRLCEALETSATLIQDPSLDVEKLTKLSSVLEALSLLDAEGLDFVHQMARKLAP